MRPLSEDAERLNKTLNRYPGWLSFRRDRRTLAAVRTLAMRGMAQVNGYDQVRATATSGEPIPGERGKAGAPLPQSQSWSVVKAQAAGL